MTKKEKIMKVKADRRLIHHIPDPEHIRLLADRRKHVFANHQKMDGTRYETEFPVTIKQPFKPPIQGLAKDLSNTGILIDVESNDHLNDGAEYKITGKIPPGSVPEGYETKFRLKGKVVREVEEQGHHYTAFQFNETLQSYLYKRRWGLSVTMASLLLLFMAIVVMLLRAESIIYFQFSKFLYFYSLVAATFLLSRYIFGMVYRNKKVDPDYTPGVSIIIPAFNEEKWIHKTILTCIDQEYPPEKLEVIVVDDHSTDNTKRNALGMIARIHKESERFQTKDRLFYYELPQNLGKREAVVLGVKKAKHDLVVFVDSDSFLEPDAIKNLVQPFKDPKMGGVAGRTEVENKYTNAITKLQTVRYYIAFRIMKAAEATFDAVTCLSGPLSCYRKDLVLENADAWINQRFLGHPATFGDDRSMTNYILKTHRTSYQDRAICSTIVPSSFKYFLKQQMRWKRSWLRESIRALSFMWKKEPFMQLFFWIGLIVPIAAPIVVAYNLIYVPIVHGVFPLTFIVGLLVMAMMMSLAHMLFKRSKLWLYGFIFVAFYEFVLLWQMPIAWVTFWKSTWGTRDTPQDIADNQRKQEKRSARQVRINNILRKGGGV